MIAAVIPCHNEAKYIAGVVEKTAKHVDEVLVVNDHSVDDTVDVAVKAGARVFSNVKSNGVGNTTQLGILIARSIGATTIVTLDGDGQHDPDDIPAFLVTMKQGYDVVIGTRFRSRNGNMPRKRDIGNRILTGIYNIGMRYSLTDCQCGMRSFDVKVFDRINLKEPGFGFITETTLKAYAAGFHIAEIPVRCIYHENYNDNSSLPAFKHGTQVALNIIKWKLLTMGGKKR